MQMIRKPLFTIFLIFWGLLLAFSDYMGIVPVPLMGIKFYGADFILIILGVMLVFYGFAPIFNNRLSLFLLVFLAFGIASLVYGYQGGHEIRDIVGEFRRIFVYSIAFAITWKLVDDPKRLLKIDKVVYLSVIPVILFSVLRAWKGISWTPRFSEEDLRAVSYVSAPVLFYVYYEAATHLMIARNQINLSRNIFWLLLVAFTLLISNYRLFWVIPLAGSIGLILISWYKGLLKNLRIIGAVLSIGFITLLALYLLKTTQNQLYLLIEQKFIEDVLGFEFVDSYRYFVWGEAWSRFSSNWIFGVGIGDRLQYELLSQDREVWYMSTSTAHNIILEILYQTGFVGFIIFILPHALFSFFVWRSIKNLPIDYASRVTGLFLTYLSMFCLGLFQPFLTVPSVAVIFYTVMGLTARYIYWGNLSLHKMEKIHANSSV